MTDKGPAIRRREDTKDTEETTYKPIRSRQRGARKDEHTGPWGKAEEKKKRATKLPQGAQGATTTLTAIGSQPRRLRQAKKLEEKSVTRH